jgi:hypothetical protein
VLLDSDSAGETARDQIRKGGAKGKPTVADDLILMVGEWAAAEGATAGSGIAIEEPEDLVPVGLAVVAARRYAKHLLGLSDDTTAHLTVEDIEARIGASGGSLWDALNAAFSASFATTIAKAGFAKELLAFLSECEAEGSEPVDVSVLDGNFASLIRRLADTLRLAREREHESRRDQRVDRIVEEFVHDHPTGCLRDRAAVMLRRIDAAADDNQDGDVIRAGTARLRRQYDLAKDPLARVAEYENFLVELRALKHWVRLVDQGGMTVEDARDVAATS